MTFKSDFVPLALEQLHREAAIKKAEGWRFIQTHAVNADVGVDLYYSFMKGGEVVNYRVEGVTKDQPVPSITDLFLAAFVFENEARELFGVDMRDIAIDFAGAMYAPAESEPMTFISPEQKEAIEKARKAAAAKAARESGEEVNAPAPAAAKAAGFVMTPERRARLDAKLATMSPEKVAKVEAALKAREAEAGGGAPAAPAGNAAVAAGTPAATASPATPSTPKDETLESKLAAMDPAKAAKVRAALAARGAVEPPVSEVLAEGELASGAALDSDLEAMLALMEPDKAAKVRAALAAKGVK